MRGRSTNGPRLLPGSRTRTSPCWGLCLVKLEASPVNTQRPGRRASTGLVVRETTTSSVSEPTFLHALAGRTRSLRGFEDVTIAAVGAGVTAHFLFSFLALSRILFSLSWEGLAGISTALLLRDSRSLRSSGVSEVMDLFSVVQVFSCSGNRRACGHHPQPCIQCSTH